MTIQEITTPVGQPTPALTHLDIDTKKFAVDRSAESTKQSSESNVDPPRHSESRRLLGTSGDARTELSIEMEKRTHRIIIKVIDVNTKEVIREIPPEGLQQIAEALQFPSGAFLDQNL
jgi:uncharacterized FlaG/YvyC family protein